MSSSNPKTNDEPVSSSSENMYYVSAECSELHDGRELLDRIYSINIDTLFNLFFTNSEFLSEFLKSRNFQNVQVGDWLDYPSTSDDKKPSHSRSSKAESLQSFTPRQSPLSKRNPLESITKSKLIISRMSLPRPSQLVDNVNNESTSDENTKSPLIAKDIIPFNNKEENNAGNNKEESNQEKHDEEHTSNEDIANNYSNIKKTKTVKYEVNSSVGSTVRVTNKFILLKCSVPNELYSINELSSSEGVLYSDTFVVNIHYCLIRVSQERTKFLVYGNVNFIKSLISFTRHIVESQVWNGLNDHFKELHIKLQTYNSRKSQFTSRKSLKHKTFSAISLRRKSKRTIRAQSPESSYDTADDENGPSLDLGISKSLKTIKRKISLKFNKNVCDTSDDCDEILVDDNTNNNGDYDFLRKIWNNYITANTGLGILIAIGLTIICLRR